MRLYPLAEGEHVHVTGQQALRVMARLTRENRPPRKGEWYLSGSIPEAYRAPNDLSTSYLICELFDPTGDREYIVRWETVVSTDQGLRDAAIKARQAQIRPNTTAVVFEVAMLDGHGNPVHDAVTVDLMEGESRCHLTVDHQQHMYQHPQGFFFCPGGPA